MAAAPRPDADMAADANDDAAASTAPPLRWGIAGCGKIAHDFALALLHRDPLHLQDKSSTSSSSSSRLVACATRDSAARARAFAVKLRDETQLDASSGGQGRAGSPARCFGSYWELSQDPDVDVVYVAVTNAHHREVCELFLRAGKHVVVEKPAAPRKRDVEELVALARANSVLFAEGLWTMFCPAVREMRARLASRNVTSCVGEFSFCAADLATPQGRAEEGGLVEKEGGALLDVGVYPLALVLACFDAEPLNVVSLTHRDEFPGSAGVDLSGGAVLTFPRGGIATVLFSVQSAGANRFNVGAQGLNMELSQPMHAPDSLTVTVQDRDDLAETLSFPHPNPVAGVEYNFGQETTAFFHEIRAVEAAIASGKCQLREHDWNAMLRLAAVMESVRPPKARRPGEIMRSELPPRFDERVVEEGGDVLGKGAYGTVYRARLRGVDVAVKMLRLNNASNTKFREEKQVRENFETEVRMLQKVISPNCCLFLGAVYGETLSDTLLVTEFCEGGTVEDFVFNKNKPIPTLDQRMRVAIGAAYGLRWLHEGDEKIIHRDLKPENLLLDRNMVCKVADFGLSGILQPDDEGLPGGNGSPWYMAPEALAGQSSTVNEKSDVFSFAMVCWEIFTGKKLSDRFGGDVKTRATWLQYLLDGTRPEFSFRDDALPELPKVVQDIISRSWATEFDDRPSMKEVTESLEETAPELKWAHFNGTVQHYGHLIFGEADSLTPCDLRLKLINMFGLADGWISAQRSVIGYAMSSEHEQSLQRDCDLAVSLLEKLLEDIANDGLIDQAAFARFCHWFGPLDDGEILQRVFNIASRPWFFGLIDKDDAESRLSGIERNIFGAPLIVRLSLAQNGAFTVSYVNELRVTVHRRVLYDNVEKHFVVGEGDGQSIFKSTDGLLGVILAIQSHHGIALTAVGGSQYQMVVSSHRQDGSAQLLQGEYI